MYIETSRRKVIMPLVKISYRSPIEKKDAELLAEFLPSVVASALHCDNPDGRLSAVDVETDVQPISTEMRTQYDLHIEIEANDYPERRIGLTMRRELIANPIRSFLSKHGLYAPGRACVWVKLFPASWGEV
jgi:hypothetical protein